MTPSEFASDVRLIFTNCYKYNPPESEYVRMARKLQVGFTDRHHLAVAKGMFSFQEIFEARFAEMPEEPSPQSSTTSSSALAGHDRIATPSPRPRGGASAAMYDDDMDDDEIDRRLVELQAQVR